jgi:hypothetical protein
MRRLSFGCEENRISLPVLPTLRRLSPFCVTPVCLERVRVAGPLMGGALLDRWSTWAHARPDRLLNRERFAGRRGGHDPPRQQYHHRGLRPLGPGDG